MTIDSGQIFGIVTGETDDEVYAYRGIPYAAPPVGELRWKAPQPVTTWSGVRDCTEFSLTAPQNEVFGVDTGTSEDCLYLNILTPAETANEPLLPVMVWMHGGLYSTGSGNDAASNHYRLPQHGVVVVTVNMRLDILGMMAHPLLSQESPQGVSGNYMFLDMIAALEWVQRNIAAFGGDRNNVTIFGGSGGGAKVATLMASPLAEGLFHRAICESGTSTAEAWFNGRPLKDLEDIGEEIFQRLGITTLEEARALPYREFYEANNAIAMETVGLWNVVNTAVDGWFLTETPLNCFRAGNINAVPLICGTNKGELTSMFPTLIPGYIEMLTALEKVGVPGYAYVFNRVPDTWRKESLDSAPHGLDGLYFFGDWDNSTGSWEGTFSYLNSMGYSLKTPNPRLTDTDKYISESMMRMWVWFALAGNPNVGLIDWPVYSAISDQYLYLDEVLEIKTGFSTTNQ